jgi:hypothetical protein
MCFIAVYYSTYLINPFSGGMRPKTIIFRHKLSIEDYGLLNAYLLTFEAKIVIL